MAQKELALYVAEQLAPLGEIRYIPMMGGWLFYYREKLDRRYLWRWVCPERYSRIQKIYAGLQGRDMGGYSGSAASLYDSGGQGKTVPDGQRDVSGSPGTKSKAGQKEKGIKRWRLIIKKSIKNFTFLGNSLKLWRFRR